MAENEKKRFGIEGSNVFCSGHLTREDIERDKEAIRRFLDAIKAYYASNDDRTENVKSEDVQDGGS